MASKPRVISSFKIKTLPPDFFSTFKKGMQLEATQQIEKIAHEVVAEAKKIIETQRYKWKPLSPAYAASKKRRGLDERMLIATRDYLDHGIGVYKSKGFICAGPLPGTHKGSKLTYQLLARFLEFGTRNKDSSGKRITDVWRMPPRPLWRPVKSIALSRSKALKKAYAQAMRKKIREATRSAKKIERTSK